MLLFSVCARRWIASHMKLLRGLYSPWTSVMSLTSPPVTADSFPYREMCAADVIYLRLHGMENQPYLYGSGASGMWETAFSLEKFVFAPEGIVLEKKPLVFMEGCFGATTGIPEVFVKAGASVVIAAKGETQNRTVSIGQAGKIGLRVVSAYLRKKNIGNILAQAEGEFGPAGFVAFIPERKESNHV